MDHPRLLLQVSFRLFTLCLLFGIGSGYEHNQAERKIFGTNLERKQRIKVLVWNSRGVWRLKGNHVGSM